MLFRSPKLRCIATHLGNWGEWVPELIRPLAALPNVYADISSSFSYAPGDRRLFDCMGAYDPTHLFFGSDYPIWCPKKELEKALALGLPTGLLERVLFDNFAAFYHYRVIE